MAHSRSVRFFLAVAAAGLLPVIVSSFAPVAAATLQESPECVTTINLDLVHCEVAGSERNLGRECVEDAAAKFFACAAQNGFAENALSYRDGRSFAFVVDGAEPCQSFSVHVENPEDRAAPLNVLNGSFVGHLEVHGAGRVSVRLAGSDRLVEFEGWSHAGRSGEFLPPGEHEVTVEVCRNESDATPFAMVYFGD